MEDSELLVQDETLEKVAVVLVAIVWGLLLTVVIIETHLAIEGKTWLNWLG